MHNILLKELADLFSDKVIGLKFSLTYLFLVKQLCDVLIVILKVFVS